MSRFYRKYKKTNSPVVLPATRRSAPCCGCGNEIPVGARSIWYPLADVIQCPACFAAGTGTPLWGTGKAGWDAQPSRAAASSDGPDRFDLMVEDRMAEAAGFSPYGPPDQY